MITLAETSLGDILSIVHMVLSFLMALALIWVANKARRVETLEKNLTAANEKNIEDRFAAMAKEFAAPFAAIDQNLEQINERLQRGEERFSNLNETDHKAEIGTLQAVANLQIHISKHCASKQDLKAVEDKLQQLAISVGHLERQSA